MPRQRATRRTARSRSSSAAFLFALTFLLIANVANLSARIAPPAIRQAAAQTKKTSADGAGIWLDVPFVKQSEDGCGSASIAMLLQYWRNHGATVASGLDDVAAIQSKLYSAKAHGIFASDMQQYFQQSGFRALAFRGDWNDLRKHLAAGRPLIVSTQPGGAKVPLHYVVVTGLDWQRDAVFVNDPARGKLLRIERAEFEKQWSAAKNWTLLAVPTSAPPAQ
ncbi:MAG TPA: C39 family peptidase [Candidatus Acidoferrum sp.]|jgi:predicted double-glycine peptidase